MAPTSELQRQLTKVANLAQAILALGPLVREEALEPVIAELADAANSALDSLLERANVRASASRTIVEDREDAAARRLIAPCEGRP